ncbi:MAG: hypothetical protein JW827_00645 [Spirochaetes bacterium]|nr:hypothetical protein [Spirochaetota bacterium]
MSPDSFNLNEFYRLLQYKFNFFQLINKFLMDGRIYPEISLEKIILSIISMPLLGITSLLQLDETNREEFQKGLFNSKHRNMVVSDSGLTYALKKMYYKKPKTLGGVTDLLSECFFEFPDNNFIIDGLRSILIDGSTFGKHFGCALYVIGKIDYLLDLVEMKKRGKEIPAAKKLARRLRDKFWKNYFDLILYDGLCRYELIQYFRKITGCHVLVKTTEKDLDIIKEVELMIKNKEKLDKFGQSIKYYQGIDEKRKEYYQIWEVDHIKRCNSDDEEEYKVARVREYEIKRRNGTWIKTNKLKEEYYGISTKQELTGIAIRKFCIRRWRIEDSGFRQLNLFAKTKRLYSKYPEIAFPLIALLILSHNLFLYFLSKFVKIGKENKSKERIRSLKFYYIFLARNTYKVGGRHPPPLAILNCQG